MNQGMNSALLLLFLVVVTSVMACSLNVPIGVGGCCHYTHTDTPQQQQTRAQKKNDESNELAR